MQTTFYELLDNLSSTSLTKFEVLLTLQIAEAVKSVGGRALVVGGYPRDLLLGHSPKDIDLEIYGLELDQLKIILQPIHHYSEVGAVFGVLKVGPLDVSIPRLDNKSGSGHTGFSVQVDPSLSHREAARRRDFTINAMALNPLTGELFDEYGGQADIKAKLLRAVDFATFAEDPLRGLRAMQFAGRFGFAVETETAELIRKLDPTEVSNERIGEEWIKLLLKSEQPSVGLNLAMSLGIISRLHPELAALVDTPQEPAWHPEGSVWNHTLLVVDVAAGIIRREGLASREALAVMLGALCHDLGKAVTTVQVANGRIRSPGHAQAGVELARTFMHKLCVPAKTAKKVERLVFDHMFLPTIVDVKDGAIRRLAKRLDPATVQELIWVTEAGFSGRKLERTDRSLINLFQKRADELAVLKSPMDRLIRGKDLLELGVRTGLGMGKILKELETAQINGAFNLLEEGIAYYKAHLQ